MNAERTYRQNRQTVNVLRGISIRFSSRDFREVMAYIKAHCPNGKMSELIEKMAE